MFKKIHNYLNRLSTIKFIIMALIVNILILAFTSFLSLHTFLSNYRAPMIQDYVQPDFSFNYVLSFIISAVIIAPIWETFVFQTIPIVVTSAIIKEQSRKRHFGIIPILISALFFAIIHYFDYGNDLPKLISTFLIGLLLAYSYTIYMHKKKRPYLITAIIHGLMNLTALIIAYNFS